MVRHESAGDCEDLAETLVEDQLNEHTRVQTPEHGYLRELFRDEHSPLGRVVGLASSSQRDHRKLRAFCVELTALSTRSLKFTGGRSAEAVTYMEAA